MDCLLYWLLAWKGLYRCVDHCHRRPLAPETIGTLPGSLVPFLKTIGTLPVLSSSPNSLTTLMNKELTTVNMDLLELCYGGVRKTVVIYAQNTHVL